jgi:hypothetical protein
MREIEPDGPLSATYRDAVDRMKTASADATRRTQAAMKSTAGWLAAAKAAAAQSVLEATRHECDVQVTRLIEAHADAGERDAAKVAALVRTRFLNELTAPGLHFVENPGPEAAALAVVAARHAAEFESFRDAFASEVADRFRLAVEARGHRAPADVATRVVAAELGMHRALFLAFLLITLLLSLAGVSWLVVIQRTVALLGAATRG